MILSRRHVLIGSAAAVMTTGCGVTPKANEKSVIEVFNPALLEVLDTDQDFEVLGTGYAWSEGPAWDKLRQRLYFTDVPGNKAFVWKRGVGVEVFLDPSGVPADQTEGFREAGANGLLMGHDGRLLVCNHGRRAVEALNIETGVRETLAGTYRGQRYNSPNDIAQAADGTIYFTDPPYGLEGLDASPLKQQDANGVYRLSPDGEVTRLADDMTFPNGICLSLDESYLLVSQSDPNAPLIRRIPLNGKEQMSVWFDATPFMDGRPGLPDGLVMAQSGHVFATGPGGVFILNAQGVPYGRINPGSASANCTFGEDGQTLFITAHDRLVRLRTHVKGAHWV